MGSFFAAPQQRRPFRARAFDTGRATGVLLDEGCSDAAGDGAADRRHPSLSTAHQIAHQQDLLAGLIGGDPGDASLSAARLLGAYGSLGRVFAASGPALRRLLGDHEIAARIGAARDAVLAGIREDFSRQKFDLHEPAIQQYVVALFKGLAAERLHAVFLDGHGRYLADGILSDGAVSHLFGNLRLIVTRAFDLGAAGVVLMHNHPSGQLAPSERDIEATRQIDRSLAELDLRLVDHLVVAGTTILSMRGAQLL